MTVSFFFSDYDPNYDIYFNHPEGLNYAWVPFPNQVTNVSTMSVSLWVRFAEAGSQGTYFTMFIGWVCSKMCTLASFSDHYSSLRTGLLLYSGVHASLISVKGREPIQNVCLLFISQNISWYINRHEEFCFFSNRGYLAKEDVDSSKKLINFSGWIWICSASQPV